MVEKFFIGIMVILISILLFILIYLIIELCLCSLMIKFNDEKENIKDSHVLGEYKPPFEIRIYYKTIFSISTTSKRLLYYLVSTIIHENIHLLQFFIIAKADAKYFETKRYRKLSEHQTYYVSKIIAKLFREKCDYPENLRHAWNDIDGIQKKY